MNKSQNLTCHVIVTILYSLVKYLGAAEICLCTRTGRTKAGNSLLHVKQVVWESRFRIEIY